MTKFNEEQYLLNYPDVAASVARGEFKNGKEHFENYGKLEGRVCLKKK